MNVEEFVDEQSALLVHRGLETAELRTFRKLLEDPDEVLCKLHNQFLTRVLFDLLLFLEFLSLLD